MKVSFQLKRNHGTDKGIALLLTCLGVAFLVGLPLTYFLVAAQSESLTVARSQAWNNAMVVAEAGLEEGLAFVNKYANGNQLLGSWVSTGSASGDNWSTSGAATNIFSKARNDIFGRGVSYLVVITNLSPTNLVIKSTGTVPGPSIWSSQSISRSVVVSAVVYGPGMSGLIAKGGVVLSGSALIDSFNSLDPGFSLNGQYTFTNHEAHGDLLIANGNLTMSGSSSIFGMVFTGPANTISTTSNNRIGDTNWGSGIEPGWTNNTANVAIADAPPMPPGATWNPLPPVSSFGSTNMYVLDGGGQGNTNFYAVPGGFNLSGSDQMVITNGGVFLQMAGSFSTSGQSAIHVTPNSTLKAWLNGDTAISGSGVINDAGYATNVVFYGTTNATHIAMSGSSEFIGVLDAPYANVNYSGSADFIGSFVVNTFNDSGGAGIHFDEGLMGGILNNGYTISSWHEVEP
jgi:hypothetical protein